jgi:hypothetical protein
MRKKAGSKWEIRRVRETHRRKITVLSYARNWTQAIKPIPLSGRLNTKFF